MAAEPSLLVSLAAARNTLLAGRQMVAAGGLQRVSKRQRQRAMLELIDTMLEIADQAAEVARQNETVTANLEAAIAQSEAISAQLSEEGAAVLAKLRRGEDQ